MILKRAFILVVFLATIPCVAFSLPELQLNIVDGTYYADYNGDGDTDDPFDEGMFIHGSSFTLQAFWSDKDNDLGDNPFYLSCSLLTPEGNRLADPTDLSGVSISIDGSDISAWSYGTPDDLAGHGVLPTYYHPYSFTFDVGSLNPDGTYSGVDYTADGIYNVQDSADPGNGSAGFIHDFSIDLSGLDHDYAMVFDLYTYETTLAGNSGNEKTKIYFAPFSHNAGASPAPEPSTIILLGAGLIGLGFLRKRTG